MNCALAAMDEEPEVLSLVLVPGLPDPDWFVPLLLVRVLLMATPLIESLVALLGKVVFVVVST